LFWAFSEGAVAAVLLLTGGLAALQTAAIITALPFVLVMIVICIGLVKGLRAEVGTTDPVAELLHKMRHLPGEMRAAVTGGVPPAGRNGETTSRLLLEGNWRGRLGKLLDKVGQYRRQEASLDHGHQTVSQFIRETVVPAFEELRGELKQYGRKVTIENDEREASLTVWRGEQEEFVYAIQGHVYHKARFAYPEQPPDQEPIIEKAEVVLRSGRQREYEIRHWTKQGIIDDFIRSYARWMGW
jgi:choline/glycine/proline betaine transport protein